MSQISQTINDTIRFRNFESPFDWRNISYGIQRKNHTTDAVLVYKSDTLPLPWPYLVASMGVSLLLAIVYWITGGFWENRKKSMGFFARLIFVVYHTIRAAIIFIRAVKAVANNSERWMSPTVLLVTMVAMAPAIATNDQFQLCVISVDILLVYTAFELMVFGRFKPGANLYGGFYLAGGNCPRLYEFEDSPNVVGCPPVNRTLQMLQDQRINRLFGPNTLTTAEFVIGVVCSLSLIIVVPTVVCASLYFVRCLIICASRRQPDKERNSQDDVNHDSKAEDLWKAKRWIGKASYIVIIIAAIIIIPQTLARQTGENQRLRIYDSFGPLAPYNRTLDICVAGGYCRMEVGESWDDMFDVQLVHHRLGFFEYWWNTDKTKPLNWLALI